MAAGCADRMICGYEIEAKKKIKRKKVGDRQTRNYFVTSEVYLLVGAPVKTSGKLDVFKKKKERKKKCGGKNAEERWR